MAVALFYDSQQITFGGIPYMYLDIDVRPESQD